MYDDDILDIIHLNTKLIGSNMGFFDKVKAFKNSITGGAAEVDIEGDELIFGQPFTLTVVAKIGDADLKVNKVNLHIKAVEEIGGLRHEVVIEDDGQSRRHVSEVSNFENTLSFELRVADAQVLSADEVYRWEVEVELPENAQPVYVGEYCRHYYKAQASLDAFGNDPDSGWLELEFS
mgnify:CR=1 FL=1